MSKTTDTGATSVREDTTGAPLDLGKMRTLIADDGYAMSFQTMGQYRSALLKEIDAAASSPQSACADAIGQDERALFEEKFEFSEMDKRGASHDVIGWYYFSERVNSMWDAWQARAALAHPAVAPAPVAVVAASSGTSVADDPQFMNKLYDFARYGVKERDELVKDIDARIAAASQAAPADLGQIIDSKCAEVKAVIGDPWSRNHPDSINAARYERLRVLGAAPGGSKQLDAGTVLRFQSLDAFVDADLDAHPSRGEAAPATCQPSGAIGQGTAALSDMDYCTLEYAERALRAITERQEVVGGAIEPLNDIRKASARAKHALSRLEPVVRRLCDLATPAEPSRAAIDTEARDAN